MLTDALRARGSSADELSGVVVAATTVGSVLVAASQASTRADTVYQRLRGDILSGRSAPGRRLKFAELCGDYSTSVGAAREALTRLVGEGLVRVQPNQGYMVTPLSHDDLADLTAARVEIESLALRLSVEQGDRTWESGVVAAHHYLQRTPFTGPDAAPTTEWASAHTAFHVALIAGCPNRRIVRIATALREEALLYQLWSLAWRQDPGRDSDHEHRELAEAATARQAVLAAKLLREHLQHTARILQSVHPEDLQPSPLPW